MRVFHIILQLQSRWQACKACVSIGKHYNGHLVSYTRWVTNIWTRCIGLSQKNHKIWWMRNLNPIRSQRWSCQWQRPSERWWALPPSSARGLRRSPVGIIWPLPDAWIGDFWSSTWISARYCRFSLLDIDLVLHLLSLPPAAWPLIWFAVGWAWSWPQRQFQGCLLQWSWWWDQPGWPSDWPQLSVQSKFRNFVEKLG